MMSIGELVFSFSLGFLTGFFLADRLIRYMLKKATGLDTNDYDSCDDFLKAYKDL